MGRRIEKVVTENSVTTTTRYLYDGFNIVAEYDENNNVKAQYIHNLGIDDQLAMVKNGQTYYYHKDGLGSVVALSDGTGAVVQKYEYDSFGNIVSVLNPNFIQPYNFTGREYDPETGLYHYRLRTYDQKTGTFTQKDPIGFAGGDVNLYRYVGNSPINFVDPFGLDKLRFHVNRLYPYIEWLDDSESLISIITAPVYSAYSGTKSGKYKPLPYGMYTGKNLRTRTKKGMRCGDKGWSLDLEPANFSTERTLLRIHPDEPPFGTEGCIGVDCKSAQKLYDKLRKYFNSGNSEISVEVTY